MMESVTISDLLVPGIIFGGAFLIFLTMMVVSVVQWIRVARASRWPVVNGTILESRVVYSRDSHGRSFCRPLVNYQYEVANQEYNNNLLAFGSRSLSGGGPAVEKEAKEVVGRYPTGGQVEVHYDPKQPAHSVLEIRTVLPKWLILGGFVFLVSGIFAAGVVLIINVAG